MWKRVTIFGVAVLLLAGCEKKQEAQAPAPAVQEESGTDRRAGEPGESPAESGQAPTVGQIRDAREETAALEPPSAPPPSEAVSPSPEVKAEKPSPAPAPASTKPAAEKPAKNADKGTKSSATPPETVVLANKNGDVTLPHRAHAELTDCSTCHGEQRSGKLDLNRDSGHKLCLGCHKEQGAGPTSCSGCHKKS